jgi:two-component system nitrate/nitrite response regulator NarL
MMRIVVAGDIRLYRDGVTLHLARDPELNVVGVAGERRELLQRVREERPAIVVLDMAMAESLDAVRDLWREAPDVRVVAITVPELERAVIACAEAGIAGYVLREGSLDDLRRTIDSVARGESIVSPKMAASLLRRVSTLAADRAAPPPIEELTLREREIVALIEEGLANKQIAARLNIELATVKNHVHRILEKLRVTRRGEIASRLKHQRASASEFPGESWAQASRTPPETPMRGG